MPTLHIDAGERTEELLQYVTAALDDATLDEVEVRRESVRPGNLATEPLTIAATLALGTTAVVAVARIVERWLENQRQLEHLRIVAQGFERSDAAGAALADLGKAHAVVSIRYGMPSSAGKERS